ncbi:hypothetical protein VTI28DRAFT_9378 [Corynascus sepedonium]
MAAASSTSSPTSTRTPLVITSFPSIPLTTTFTPPGTDCGGIYLPSDLPVYIIDNEPSCLPSRFSTSDSSFFYSPGIACPSGYWTACHDTAGVSSITTVTCCPTYGDISLSCVPRPHLLSEVWETLFCTWEAPPGTAGTVITVTESANGGRTSTVTEQVFSPGGVNAYGVRMVYEATDLQTATSSSRDGSSTGNSDNDNDPTDSGSSPSATADPSSDSGSGGLSTGAKAAIGVVIPVVVIGAALLVLALWRKRKKREQQAQQLHELSPGGMSSDMPGQHHNYYGASSAGDEGSAGWKQPAEYHYYSGVSQQQEVHEAPGSTWQPSEMPSTLQAAELPTASSVYPR